MLQVKYKYLAIRNKLLYGFESLWYTDTVTNNSNNSYDNLDLVWLNLYSEKMNCVYRRLVVFVATPCTATCHVTLHARPTCSRDGNSETELADRRIGLNMNFSIIFTEISFSPETSSLLQIIRIIHMTIWIIQNLTEKGGQSVRSGSKVVYTMRFPQTKTCLDKSPLGGPSRRPPPL